MSTYHYHFETDVEFRFPVSRHAFMLRCLPLECMCQHVIYKRYTISEASWHSEGVDVFGNNVIYGSIDEAHNHFSIVSEGEVSMRHYAIYDEVKPWYTNPSPLTTSSAEMHEFTKELLNGIKAATSYDKAIAFSHAVHDYLEYQGGVTGSHTTAAEAFKLKTGVCQDYSHILITLCHDAGIAARYVSGFVSGEGASHAWVEVYDKSRWLGIDPTNDCPTDNGYIIIAHGRDADDCPLNRGIYTGPTDELMTIRVKVQKT